jgi:hypothetical protein
MWMSSDEAEEEERAGGAEMDYSFEINSISSSGQDSDLNSGGGGASGSGSGGVSREGRRFVTRTDSWWRGRGLGTPKEGAKVVAVDKGKAKVLPSSGGGRGEGDCYTSTVGDDVDRPDRGG